MVQTDERDPYRHIHCFKPEVICRSLIRLVCVFECMCACDVNIIRSCVTLSHV